MPAQNARPRPVTTTAATSSSAAGALEGVDQLLGHRHGEGVELVGPVERQGQDAVGDRPVEGRVVRARHWFLRPEARHSDFDTSSVRSSWIRRNSRFDALRVPVHRQVGDGDAAGETALAVDPGHRPRELHRGDHRGVLADPQRVLARAREPEVADRVDDRPRRGRLGADRADHLALVPGPVDVAEARGVPRPGVAERDLAVGLLAALLDVEVRLRVLHRGLRADLDPAHRVDHVDEAAEADLDVVVDADAGGLLDRLDEELRPAVRERGVDLRGRRPRARRRCCRAGSTSAGWDPSRCAAA